jgi:hypothetical protein
MRSLSLPALGKINSVHTPPILFLSEPLAFEHWELRDNVITGWQQHYRLSILQLPENPTSV